MTLRFKLSMTKLEEFRGDVLLGCDIERNGVLYRQKKVVEGPGLTEDEIALLALKQALASIAELVSQKEIPTEKQWVQLRELINDSNKP